MTLFLRFHTVPLRLSIFFAVGGFLVPKQRAQGIGQCCWSLIAILWLLGQQLLHYDVEFRRDGRAQFPNRPHRSLLMHHHLSHHPIFVASVPATHPIVKRATQPVESPPN